VIFFPSVLWHCWLGDRKGIRPVKKLDDGLLMVVIWLKFCTTYSSSSPAVATTSIILCFNKHRLTQVHLENGHWNGERDCFPLFPTCRIGIQSTKVLLCLPLAHLPLIFPASSVGCSWFFLNVTHKSDLLPRWKFWFVCLSPFFGVSLDSWVISLTVLDASVTNLNDPIEL